jgi:putative transcriptional regulator
MFAAGRYIHQTADGRRRPAAKSENSFGISKLILLERQLYIIMRMYLLFPKHPKESRDTVAVSYKKLWHILLDKNMKKKQLQQAAKLTGYAMNKLSRNEAVTTDVLAKVCLALDCTPDDIMEILPDDEE